MVEESGACLFSTEAGPIKDEECESSCVRGHFARNSLVGVRSVICAFMGEVSMCEKADPTCVREDHSYDSDSV